MMTPEEKKAKRAAYYQANKAKLLARMAQRYTENPDLFLARCKAYQRANPDRLLEYRKINSKKAVATMARWAAENPERHIHNLKSATAAAKARRVGVAGHITADDIAKQFNSQDGRCFYCHEQLRKFQIDHKTPFAKGGSNWPDNVVCACQRCNLRKGTKTAEEFLKILGDE